MKKNICCVLLEYCGGKKSDSLYLKLSKWNPGYKINVLDNASPYNKSSFVTHQNKENSGIGGGIIDSLKIAKEEGAKYLLFITNDITPITKISFNYFEEILNQSPDIIQLSTSITVNSDQSRYYPWMINERKYENRIVPHADILCCSLSIDFIESFGSFPISKSGWGYDWEIAYHANLFNKKIVVSDHFTIKHVNEPWKKEDSILSEKQRELEKIYNSKYGSYKQIYNECFNI